MRFPTNHLWPCGLQAGCVQRCCAGLGHFSLDAGHAFAVSKYPVRWVDFSLRLADHATRLHRDQPALLFQNKVRVQWFHGLLSHKIPHPAAVRMPATWLDLSDSRSDQGPSPRPEIPAILAGSVDHASRPCLLARTVETTLRDSLVAVGVAAGKGTTPSLFATPYLLLSGKAFTWSYRINRVACRPALSRSVPCHRNPPLLEATPGLLDVTPFQGRSSDGALFLWAPRGACGCQATSLGPELAPWP